MPAPVTSVFEPVLGTRLALRLTAATHQALARAEDAVLAECDRLEDLAVRLPSGQRLEPVA